MYGFATSFILIFLTHPGVAYNFFDPGIPGGLFQAAFVLLLSIPSDSGAGFSNVMSIVYWVMLAIWAYVKVRLTLAGR
jgi:hypothetical protein